MTVPDPSWLHVVLSGVCLHTGRFAERGAEASRLLLRGPARDFQGGSRANGPSWFHVEMDVLAL